jgi:flagellar hook-associated protein 2
MATSSISSAGIGSGLDVSNIITQLMAVERQPIAKLDSAAGTMKAQLSAFGQMQSLVSALRDAAAPLFAADSFALTTATTTDPTTLGVGSTAKAVPGSYSVSVAQLAATQTVVGAGGQFGSAADVVGTGTLTIRLGTWATNQTAFTPKPDTQDISIAIGAEDNTLAKIRDKINAANAGVTATIVTDANGARLAIQSTATGATNGFRIGVADDDTTNTDAAGLSRLAFDPPAGSAGMSLTTAAQNTVATVNGISVTSTGSTLSDVVEGLTLTLNKVTTAPVTVTVNRNTDALKTMVTSFVTAYNALNSFLGSATKYDAESKRGALLQGDRTALGLQGQLRALLGGNGTASTAFPTLSSIGLEFQKDGALKVNDTKLAAALKNPVELKKALANVDIAAPANNGFAKKIAAWSDVVLGTEGALPSRQKSIQARIAANTKDKERAEARLVLVEQRLRAQYTALDATMSRANALSQYVTQQITTWNKQKE